MNVFFFSFMVLTFRGTFAIACENPAGEFDNDGLVAAVNLYENDREAAETQYGPIQTWCTGQVTNMARLFDNKQTFNAPIGSWDVSSVTTMFAMFRNARSFNQDLSSWNVTSVRNMAFLFDRAFVFDQDISGWDVRRARSMNAMFRHARRFNRDLGNWDVSRVVNMVAMFAAAHSFNQDLSSWDVSGVTDMRNMFYLARSYDQDLCSWEDAASSLELSSARMFEGTSCASQVNPLETGNWCTVCAPTTPLPTSAPVLQTPHPSGIFPFPSGPYVTPGYSEIITIPDPPAPSFLTGNERFGCPHLVQTGLVNWNTAGLTPASPGRNVTLPANSRILISASIGMRLGYVRIPDTSELILGENNDGIVLDMAGMVVEGRFVAGSESCRLETPVVLTFYGERPDDAVTNVPSPEVKGISVTGEISLHGQLFHRTWTRLSRTVEPGDRVLMLQHPINWEVGQRIVLVTTAMKDSREWHQNEELTIEYVFPTSPGGSAIQVSSPVQYRHVATGNYQAEVGLLSRTILIQGSSTDSEPSDPDPLDCSGEAYNYGDRSRPCPNTELSGYGAHIMVHGGGRGFVEGVELFRVGQTNVLGRYPMHFHLLGDCPECYFRDSSVHRSFYRCISIHGTHSTTVTENVAYDVSGFCYYLEDGVETNNLLGWNLAAHIHLIGPEPPTGAGQTTPYYTQSETLTLPADVTAAGFYITNIDNNVIGNSASGGWAGFAFPILPRALGPHNHLQFRPSSATGQGYMIDGNTAHSTGWWWYHTGAFYFGGVLYYENDILTYNPGRSFNFWDHRREPCRHDFCATDPDCHGWCDPGDMLWIRMTNSKAFLSAGVGLNSWSGRMELIGFESHDNGLSVEALESGFWIDNMLSVCRTGEPLSLPTDARSTRIRGDGFFWYDTAQEHIITNSTFRNCGYRSDDFNQYNSAPDRGCGDETNFGCSGRSTVFGFLTHSDEHNPEIMQGTSEIRFENCGRRFKLHDFRGDSAPSTVSGRLQNWLDADGSVTGFNEPSIIGSGLSDCGNWWSVEDSVFNDTHGPLTFIRQNNGPERGLGYFYLEWDRSLHSQVGSSICGNGNGLPCEAVGHIRHAGPRFSGDLGLPVTANAEVAGLVGGFGWYLRLNGGAPRTMTFSLLEIPPESPMILSIAYPVGTTFNITANAAWCWEDDEFSCVEVYSAVNTPEEVRQSAGNTYHISPDGVLTFRIVQIPQTFVGNPDWFLPSWDDLDRDGQSFALHRFERRGVRLPIAEYGPFIQVAATCGGSGAYCSGTIASTAEATVDAVCPSGYVQTSYDQCCSGSNCVFANGQALRRYQKGLRG